jgi:hypothetical protein
MEQVTSEIKVCSKCMTEQDRKNFCKGKRFSDGLQPWCRVCSKAYRNEKRRHLYSLAEKRRVSPEYRKRECQKQRERHDAHNNKCLLESARRRAKLNGLPFNLELEDIEIPVLCPVLGIPMKKRTRYAPSLDKIIPSLGYVKGNIQVVSRQANTMKNNATPEELLAFSRHWKKRLEVGTGSSQ